MSFHSTIDTSKSLAQLTGKDWGPAPSDARELVRERHELYFTPISKLPDGGLARLLELGIGGEFLVPVSLERLHSEPDSMTLLCAVLRDETFHWRLHSNHLAALRDSVYRAAGEVAQITDDLERFGREATMWRLYEEFERRLTVA